LEREDHLESLRDSNVVRIEVEKTCEKKSRDEIGAESGSLRCCIADDEGTGIVSNHSLHSPVDVEGEGDGESSIHHWPMDEVRSRDEGHHSSSE
ncbi:hypothetical protein PENTCL1PPCAC_6614, partial [Pristionchus entomophagus]